MYDQPRRGDWVLSLDRAHLGTVTAVSGTSFRVSSPEGERWLGLLAVFSQEQGAVTLVCTRDRLQAYLLPGPSAA